MAKLSSLEKKALKKVFDELQKINFKRAKFSDSVDDVLCNQVDLLGINEEGKLVLEAFIEYARLNDKYMQVIFDDLSDLIDHFID